MGIEKTVNLKTRLTIKEKQRLEDILSKIGASNYSDFFGIAHTIAAMDDKFIIAIGEEIKKRYQDKINLDNTYKDYVMKVSTDVASVVESNIDKIKKTGIKCTKEDYIVCFSNVVENAKIIF